MDPVERKLRDFRAAFYVTPQFAGWLRTRARELTREGETFEVVLVWGRRRFHVGALPCGDPYFAILRANGSIERSPWAR